MKVKKIEEMSSLIRRRIPVRERPRKSHWRYTITDVWVVPDGDADGYYFSMDKTRQYKANDICDLASEFLREEFGVVPDRNDYSYMTYPDGDAWLCYTDRSGHYQIRIDSLVCVTVREMKSAGVKSDMIYSE